MAAAQTRRTASDYASRTPNDPIPAVLDGYPQKRTVPARRPVAPQPVPPTSDGQENLGTVPSNSARPIAIAPASASSGVGRVSSHRRRQSQQIPLSGPQGAAGPPPPAAPEVPRGPPPTSYRDPHAPRGASRSQPPTRTYSGRSRDPTLHMNASRQQPHIRVPSGAPIPSQGSPISPLDPLSATLKGVGIRDTARRPSVPERSPLQTLEGKLDDISKEERRIRMEEAEWAAQKRAEAERQARRAREAAAAAAQQRNVSGPMAAPAPTRIPSTRRHVSMPIRSIPSTNDPDSPVLDLSEPWDPNGGRAVSGSQSHRLHHVDGAVARVASIKGKEPVGVNRGPSFRDRAGAHRSAESANLNPQPGERSLAGTSPKGLGLYALADTPQASRPVGASISRYDSKRLSKALPPTPSESQTVHVQKTRDSRGILAAQKEMEQQRLMEPQPQPQLQQRPPAPVTAPAPPEPSRHHVAFDPPPAAGDMSGPADEEVDDGVEPGNSALWGYDPDRRYQPRPFLEEWRSAPAATLLLEDLELDMPDPGHDDSQNKAWWEETQADRKRRSSTFQQTTYDGYVDEPSGMTAFNPPLYLRCGPLLRYTGMRKEKRLGKEREIWRGSIMIVTSDEDSSYAKPPTLRIFKQPVDLLPPPPAEVATLNPEYVDPIEGQVKMSRTGKTLYVKPIEEIVPGADLSQVEDDSGLFQETRITSDLHAPESSHTKSSRTKRDGEKVGKVREIAGVRLHAEQGVTFWRFNLEIELGSSQTRVAYRINRGPAIGFWVPARGETMNIMFHSCNGFSLSVDSKEFCGPDPLWRDVLNSHQTRPFHVMVGGGDQIYNDAVVRQTTIFQKWINSKNPLHKHDAPFSEALQEELEAFFLNRYSMWFSQGLFGMAASQIPMVNIWDDHDIIDGYGSYGHGFMSTPVFEGLGAVAFKYYMLFQHQSVISETEKTEPSWVLGAKPGPYIHELSRSIFMFLGRQVAFLGLDCRTERRRDEVLAEETYNLVLDRVEDELIKGETKHLIVLLGVPIAYPRLNFLENILTSRIMNPIKAVSGLFFPNFRNKFNGEVEILDDLNDHWTAKHHKVERRWFIEQLQHIASEKSVRITILSGDVHLASVGQFFTNKQLEDIPKDKDHRYMPNVISSAIVNTPPPDVLADVLNKRNKIHHLDESTDEDLIPIFTHDVDGKKRNNNCLLPRRNWCSLREYKPGTTPPRTPEPSPPPTREGPKLIRTLSDSAPGQLVRRISTRGRNRDKGPPISYYNNPAYAGAESAEIAPAAAPRSRRNSLSSLFRRRASVDSVAPPGSAHSAPTATAELGKTPTRADSDASSFRPTPFQRRPTLTGKKAKTAAYVNLEGGLDICLNVEVSQKDPAGITTPYRLLVPALDYTAQGSEPAPKGRSTKNRLSIFNVFGSVKGRKKRTIGDDGYSHAGSDESLHSDAESQLGEVEVEDELEKRRREDKARYRVGPRILLPSFSRKKDKDVAKARDSGYTDVGTVGSSPGKPASGGPITAADIEVEETGQPHARLSTSVPEPPAVSAYQAQARSQAQSAGLKSGYHTHARAPSIQQHNSSHRSQLPAPVAPQPPPTPPNYLPQSQPPPKPAYPNQPQYQAQLAPQYSSQSQPQHRHAPSAGGEGKVYRRSMGGILNQHRDSDFEHEAHVLSHTPSQSQPQGHGAHRHHHHHGSSQSQTQSSQQYSSTHRPSQHQPSRHVSSGAPTRKDSGAPRHPSTKEKRMSYPPHPAVVGAGPGSPYARPGSKDRSQPQHPDSVAREGRRNFTVPGKLPPTVTVTRGGSGERPGQADYFSSGGRGVTAGMGRDVAGVGARYLGGGRYADGSDDEDDDRESRVSYDDDEEYDHGRRNAGKKFGGAGGVGGRLAGGNAVNASQETFDDDASRKSEGEYRVKPSKGARWKIWKVL